MAKANVRVRKKVKKNIAENKRELNKNKFCCFVSARNLANGMAATLCHPWLTTLFGFYDFPMLFIV